MIIHYSNECKEELTLIENFFNWVNLKTKNQEHEKEEFISFSKGKNCPILFEGDRILGIGFYGIVKYMESKKT